MSVLLVLRSDLKMICFLGLVLGMGKTTCLDIISDIATADLRPISDN
jgi:hypothetical protein